MDLIKSIFSKTVVGLDIGVSSIKAVELSVGKQVSLLGYNRIPLPMETITADGVVKNEAAIISALKKLFAGKNFSSRNVSVSVFGNSILSKPISMPQMSRKDIEDQIYWEAEQYIPFNIDECHLDFAVIGNTVQKVSAGAESTIEVLLVAAKRDYIQSFTHLIESAELKPTVIDYQAFALGNAFEFNYRDELTQVSVGETDVIIDFGAGSTKVCFVEKQNTVFNNKLSACGNGCTQVISERVGESLSQAEQIKLNDPESPLIKPIIDDYNTHLALEVQKTIEVFFNGNPERHLRNIYYCGGAAQTPGLEDRISQIYPEQVEKLESTRNLKFPRQAVSSGIIADLSSLGAVAVGLALRRPGDLK